MVIGRQPVIDALKADFRGVILLAGTANGAVSLLAYVSADFIDRAQAGKIIQATAPIVGGKGGGKADAARGGGKNPSKIGEALTHAKRILSS